MKFLDLLSTERKQKTVGTIGGVKELLMVSTETLM